MLRRRWIGIVLRVLPMMIVYYATILMSSITVNAVLWEGWGGGTSSAGIAGEVDFPGRIMPPFPFALSTPTTINNFLSNTGDVM